METYGDKLFKVRKIVSSAKFQALADSHKLELVERLVDQGMRRSDVLGIISDVQQSTGKIASAHDILTGKTAPAHDINFLESLPYDILMSIIQSGNIKGKDLLSLCDTSPIISKHCNRDLVLPDGTVKTQYLFRKQLEDIDIKGMPWKTSPRQLYAELAQSYKVWTFGNDDYRDEAYHRYPVWIEVPRNIKQVACGSGQTLLLDTNGVVLYFGRDHHAKPYHDPVWISMRMGTKIIQVAAGEDHNLLLDESGRVWGFGNNSGAQLGLGHRQEQVRPAMIPGLTNIISVVCGQLVSMFIDKDRRVWSCGRNFVGQLGLGDTIGDRLIPTLIPNFKNAFQIAIGDRSTFILDMAGNVWGCGSNEYGDLGLPRRMKIATVPTRIPVVQNIIKIACYESHTLFLDRNGKVWGCGRNFNGELGPEGANFETGPRLLSGVEDIIDVAAGSSHSLFLDKRGRVWGRGSDFHGQLGLSNETDQQAVRARVYVPAIIPSFENVKHVIAGGDHTIILTSYFY